VIIFLTAAMRNPEPNINGAHVLVTWPEYPSDSPHAGARLTAAGLTIKAAPTHADRTPDELSELAAGAVAAIVSTDPFDASVFRACPLLRVIARVGVGVDSIDLLAASQAGVAVTITPGANESTAADHTVALILAAVRRLAEHDAAVRRGAWLRSGSHTPWDLAGATVGLVGYGRIGRLVARRLAGFEVRVIVNDPVVASPGSVRRVSLEQLLATAGIVSIHTPLTEETRSLIGPREIELMRPDAILVNTSRGGVVDQDAMIDALESGRIRAAALDVFATEPPQDQRLLRLPNVVLTPHTAGISEQSVRQMVQQATGSVLTVLDGEIPNGLANREVLDHTTLLPVGAAAQSGSVAP
jgi:phosphoglycerate dehydrogenase-like enzyme